MIQSFYKGWKPVHWTVGELYVISRPDDVTPYSIKHTIKLSGTKAAEEDSEKAEDEAAVKGELAPCFYQMAGNDLRLNCTWEEDAYETAQAQVCAHRLTCAIGDGDRESVCMCVCVL